MTKPAVERIDYGEIELEGFFITADAYQFIIYKKTEAGKRNTSSSKFHMDIKRAIEYLGRQAQYTSLKDIQDMKALFDELGKKVKELVDYEIKVRQLRKELVN